MLSGSMEKKFCQNLQDDFETFRDPLFSVLSLSSDAFRKKGTKYKHFTLKTKRPDKRVALSIHKSINNTALKLVITTILNVKQIIIYNCAR